MSSGLVCIDSGMTSNICNKGYTYYVIYIPTTQKYNFYYKIVR